MSTNYQETIMSNILIKDWIEEFQSLTESEIHTYALEQEHNFEIIIALYHMFNDYSKYTDLLEPVCQQLFGFYRCGEPSLIRFTLQFIPSLVVLYLSERHSLRCVETLLIGLYNLEIVDSSGQPKVISFRVPSIAQASIYHEPMNLGPAFLTESSLRRYEDCNTKLVNWGPLPQVEALNAQNRLRVVTALVFLYNQQLGRLQISSLEQACKATSRLVTQGFNHAHISQGRNSQNLESEGSFGGTLRIPVSSQLLLELLQGIHHALQGGAGITAQQALTDLRQRAVYETYIEVILAANAVLNLKTTCVGDTTGVNIISTQPNISKSMITNASFRTKKLPDDIPIQLDKEETEPMGTIAEEAEESEKSRVFSGGAGNALKHLPKTLSGLGKKVKDSRTKNSPTPQETARKSVEIVPQDVPQVSAAAAPPSSSSAAAAAAAAEIPSEEIEFKRLSSGDQVSLISGSFQTQEATGAPDAQPNSAIMTNHIGGVHVSAV